MDFNTILLIFIAFIGLFLVVQNQRKKDNTQDQVSQNIITDLQQLKDRLFETNNEQRKEVQERLDRFHDQMAQNMDRSQQSMQKQFSETAKIIQDVTKKLVSLDETNKQVLDFSSQLKNLQDILKNPKQRGVLGEYWLETLLSNVLPAESYKMQYEIGIDENTGKKLIADAIIRIRESIIAIDAKFSLENYNRMMKEHDPERKGKLEKQLKSDIKTRIDETSKYIKPELGTMNFAFMFIPAEGVYYNLLNAEVGSGINSKNLVEYAFQKHVMIVSPTSFYAYLQTVLLGLRELQLEKSTQEMIKRVGELGKHFHAYSEYHEKLGKNLGTVVNQYNQSSSELRKVSKDVIKITSGDSDQLIETENITKPLLDTE